MIDFILVPDSGAARRLRRVIATKGAVAGLVVGTWGELLEQARSAYLLPRDRGEWETSFHSALASTEGSFWSQSYERAPQETATAIQEALVSFITASDPTAPIDHTGIDTLPARPKRHLRELLALWGGLAGELPPILAQTKALIESDRAPLHPLRVHRMEGFTTLDRWQSRLIEKLQDDAARFEPDAVASSWTGLLETTFGASPLAPRNSALATLASSLFDQVEKEKKIDDTLQWVAVRDYQEEAEIAAGMAQRMLKEDRSLSPADIGLLIPDRQEYLYALRDAFTLAGLPLSGAPEANGRRDLGSEVVFHFLYCRQKPSPAMAMAVCLSSPLMPWSLAEGAALAQEVMDGKYTLKAPSTIGRDGVAMLDLIREGDSKPKSLNKALRGFVERLSMEERYREARLVAEAKVDHLCSLLAGKKEIDWRALRRATSPSSSAGVESGPFYREGITVWRELHEPWRMVRRLIILGFSQGRYPALRRPGPVFSAADMRAIGEQTPFSVRTIEEGQREGRLLFRRQLGSVAEEATFLVPRRDPFGEPLAPSDTMTFIRQMVAPQAKGENLLLEIDVAEDRSRIRHLAVAKKGKPIPPRSIVSEDLSFDRDLLKLNKGALKPISPSSLETLMVSPLAWLLSRLGAEPKQWAPESPSVMLLGTLAHEAFEHLFPAGEPLIPKAKIANAAQRLLDDAIGRMAPFLNGSPWKVEREHFIAGVIKAATAWRESLAKLEADILANEIWLQGKLGKTPIHGKADQILSLPARRLLIVDFKRSSSGGRKIRMQKGFESQGNLYRLMLKSGGLKYDDDKEMAETLATGRVAGIVYYTMNDQTALTDARLDESSTLPGWIALENDVSAEAMALIQQTLDEIRSGVVRLNREGDADAFKKAGVTPYALDNSPLISLFTLEDRDEEEEE
jgi:hypothetical protein